MAKRRKTKAPEAKSAPEVRALEPLGTDWVDRTIDPAYRFVVNGTSAVPQAPWNGDYPKIPVASYALTMLFNDHEVTATMATPAVDDFALLFLRSNDSQQVFLIAENNAHWYVARNFASFSDLSGYVVEQYSPDVMSWADGDKLTIKATGNVYSVHKNGTYLFNWTDDEGVYAPYVDEAHHECAIGYVCSVVQGGFDHVWMDDLYVWPSRLGSAGEGTLTATADGTVTVPIPTAQPAFSGSGALSATAASFVPFSEENLPVTDAPVPIGAGGAYVTLVGAGGGGGLGWESPNKDRGGGAGGGGAAKVHRVYIPIALLGPTYTVTRPMGGLSQANGGDATFMSGSINLSAGGGGAGGSGTETTPGTAGGGGVGSALGVTTTVDPGGPGGTGGGPNGDPGGPASNMTTGGAPGGGGATGFSSTGNSDDSGAGGNSATASGGAALGPGDGDGVPGQNASDGYAGGGGGGATNKSFDSSGKRGGDAGDFGAGGGGGMGGNAPGTNAGGTGGDSYTRVEWVADEFSAENTPVTDAPIPPGKTGVWVTLIGAGGGGGLGYESPNRDRYGGSGGGGGAKIDRLYIPVTSLGTTYTVTCPLGGASQTDGGAATFVSGGVSMSAGGGTKGGDGLTDGFGPPGVGGTTTAAGVTVVGHDGTMGGPGGMPEAGGGSGSNAPDNLTGGAPGGGGGNGMNGLGLPGPSSGKGGNSATASGGAALVVDQGSGRPGGSAASGNAGGGGGGAANTAFDTNGLVGGDGGDYGAGGGGGSGGTLAGPGGTGGDSYSMVQWV